jgi:hypothetical protein
MTEARTRVRDRVRDDCGKAVEGTRMAGSCTKVALMLECIGGRVLWWPLGWVGLAQERCSAEGPMGVIRTNPGEGLDLVLRLRSRATSGVLVYVAGTEYLATGYLHPSLDTLSPNCWMRLWAAKGM